MTIDMSQFYQVFFDEAEELLAEKEKLLLELDVANPDEEDLNAIFRCAHSIKGGAATFGLTDMIEVTHVLESLLDKIRKGEMGLTAEHVDAFLITKDILKMLLDGHRFGAAVDLDAVADARVLLQSLSEDGMSIATPEPALVEKIKEVASPDQIYAHSFNIELPLIDHADLDALTAELGLLGYVEKLSSDDNASVLLLLKTDEGPDDIMAICSFLLNPDDIHISPNNQIGSPAAKSVVEEDPGYGFFEPIEDMFKHLDTPGTGDGAQTQNVSRQPVSTLAEKNVAKKEVKEPEKHHSSQEASTIRVGIEKVDQLINLIGELVITHAMLEQRSHNLDPITHERLLNSVGQLTRNTRDLQQAVMSIRMMPMDYVFSRFPRMVRDLAAKLGKKVEFVTYGASTELDKGLIERIVDPLTHLVRNSIDHGIEMPAQRVQAGKGERGKLALSAVHQGGNIVIEVSDDGGGLNREKILSKARQQGLTVSDSMTDSDVWALIFAPGFSTAEIVTDVSGRGVGMDVVKRNITAMGGVVDIRSAKGFGTTITISLPLTLAILDGMSIKVGDEIYILPLSFVKESLQPEVADVKEITGKGKVVKVRDEYLPLIPIYQRFDIEPKYKHPSEGIVVIVEVDGKRSALFVDDLVGQQQVVVKNIESNYKKVPGVSGATILGDGGVSLILDVAAISRSVM
jgi:two-component system chemotaxis sensor kinase CheA